MLFKSILLICFISSGVNSATSNDTVLIENDPDLKDDCSKGNATHSIGVTANDYKININSSIVQVSCLQNLTVVGSPVEIVNASRMAIILHPDLNVTSKQNPGNCVAVLFYSPSCVFSCLAAPHFNALPRFFPDIKMVAIDAMTNKGLSAQYGVFGIPTLMLFHNGRPAARLNETSNYSLKVFTKFITTSTGVEPTGTLVVTSADFKGPVSSVHVKEKDYYLLLAWTVIAIRLAYSFYCSSWGRLLIDATLSAWREAEAQHHHID